MRKIIVLSFALLFLTCATTGQLMDIKLKMTQSDVISKLGKPEIVRGAILNKYGQSIEVWEYILPKEQSLLSKTYTYWLYFCDGKLVQWGQPGDWKKEADRIYEIRFGD